MRERDGNITSHYRPFRQKRNMQVMGSPRIPYQIGLGSRKDRTAKTLCKEVGLEVVPKAREYQNGGEEQKKDFPGRGIV